MMGLEIRDEQTAKALTGGSLEATTQASDVPEAWGACPTCMRLECIICKLPFPGVNTSPSSHKARKHTRKRMACACPEKTAPSSL